MMWRKVISCLFTFGEEGGGAGREWGVRGYVRVGGAVQSEARRRVLTLHTP